MKKCTVGDPCGDTCIEKSDVCHSGIGGVQAELLDKVKGIIPGKKTKWISTDKEGGFGAVFLSEDGKWIKKKAHKGAIKSQEVELTKLIHPGAFSEGNSMIMPLLPGKTADEVKRDKGIENDADIPVSDNQLKSIIDQIATLHKAGYVHKDLFNRNILIDDQSDTANIIDFGIAKKYNIKDKSPIVSSWEPKYPIIDYFKSFMVFMFPRIARLPGKYGQIGKILDEAYRKFTEAERINLPKNELDSLFQAYDKLIKGDKG